MSKSIVIQKVKDSDAEDIWSLFCEVVNDGDAFCSDESVSKEKALDMWLTRNTYVALINNEIVGAYDIFPNNSGRGSHIACASFMVKRKYRRMGIGQALGEHSIKTAKENGFTAIQFNSVVSTNIGAVNLWGKLGFEIVGKVPKAFKHKDLGLVDTYIMFRSL